MPIGQRLAVCLTCRKQFLTGDCIEDQCNECKLGYTKTYQGVDAWALDNVPKRTPCQPCADKDARIAELEDSSVMDRVELAETYQRCNALQSRITEYDNRLAKAYEDYRTLNARAVELELQLAKAREVLEVYGGRKLKVDAGKSTSILHGTRTVSFFEGEVWDLGRDARQALKEISAPNRIAGNNKQDLLYTTFSKSDQNGNNTCHDELEGLRNLEKAARKTAEVYCEGTEGCNCPELCSALSALDRVRLSTDKNGSEG